MAEEIPKCTQFVKNRVDFSGKQSLQPLLLVACFMLTVIIQRTWAHVNTNFSFFYSTFTNLFILITFFCFFFLTRLIVFNSDLFTSSMPTTCHCVWASILFVYLQFPVANVRSWQPIKLLEESSRARDRDMVDDKGGCLRRFNGDS